MYLGQKIQKIIVTELQYANNPVDEGIVFASLLIPRPSQCRLEDMNLFIHRCMFICFSEEQCDYFTVTTPCHFGSFNYSGNPLSDTSSDIRIRFKKSNDSEITTIIDNCSMNDTGNRVAPIGYLLPSCVVKIRPDIAMFQKAGIRSFFFCKTRKNRNSAVSKKYIINTQSENYRNII